MGSNLSNKEIVIEKEAPKTLEYYCTTTEINPKLTCVDIKHHLTVDPIFLNVVYGMLIVFSLLAIFSAIDFKLTRL